MRQGWSLGRVLLGLVLGAVIFFVIGGFAKPILACAGGLLTFVAVQYGGGGSGFAFDFGGDSRDSWDSSDSSDRSDSSDSSDSGGGDGGSSCGGGCGGGCGD